MFNSVCAFQVMQSSQNQEAIYFNPDSDLVKVETSENVSFLKVEYGMDSNLRTQLFPFVSCGVNNCVFFDLSDIITSNNDTLSDSVEFKLDLNGTVKSIYLDNVRPNASFTSSSFDLSTKKISLGFDYSDDVAIDKVELFVKSGNNKNLILNITSQKNYDYVVSSSGTYEFFILVTDRAGYNYETSKSVLVGDLDVPVITTAFLVKNSDGSFDLTLKLSDNTKIDRFEIVQGSLSLKESIGSSSYSKTIRIPYTSGKANLVVYDEVGNKAEKQLSLDVKISNNYYSIYSNERYFKFKSDAESCYLTKVNRDTKSSKFSEDKDVFSVKVSVDEGDKNNIEFYCEKQGFRQNFQREFVYDTKSPSDSKLSIEKDEDGYLVLKWTESKDDVSEVDYALYRDRDKIYSGGKLEYVDKKVAYPDKYTYYLKISDEAGNDVKSNEVSEVPNKVKVDLQFDSNLPINVENKNYVFSFFTETGVDVTLKLENGGKVISEKTFKSTSENIKVNLELMKGKNIITVNVKDSLGITEMQSYEVIYNEVILSAVDNTQNSDIKVSNEVKPGVVEAPAIKPENVSLAVTETETEINQYSNWLWFVIIIFGFGYFIWFFVINEDYLRIKDRYRAHKNRSQLKSNRGKRKFDPHFFALKRDKDNVLIKDFDRIQKSRIAKQEETRREEMKRKMQEEKVKGRTEFERQKLAELARRNKEEVSIPFTERFKQKRRVQKLKKEVDYDQELETSLKEKEKTVEKAGFFSRVFSGKNEVKKPKTEFDNYIERSRNNSGWNSSSDYVAKPVPVVPVEKPKEDLTNLESSKKDELPVKKSFFSRNNVEPVEKKSEPVAVEEALVVRRSPEQERKMHLDDYLNNIVKGKKKKTFYFAEKSVESDLRSRK